jgi:hypothetical protein
VIWNLFGIWDLEFSFQLAYDFPEIKEGDGSVGIGRGKKRACSTRPQPIRAGSWHLKDTNREKFVFFSAFCRILAKRGRRPHPIRPSDAA